MDTKRIEALADGVFAIAMTLLVLEVHVPDVAPPVTGAALWGSMVALARNLAGYGVSFVILGTLWIGLHNQFHFIRRTDRTLLWINVFFLMCVSFLPFGTALLAKYSDQPLAAVVYGGTLVLAGVFLHANWSYATRGRRLVDAGLDEQVVRRARVRIRVGLAVYGVATAVSVLSMAASLALFATMPIVYMLPGEVDLHLER
jgi:uncharacterized membrane protein